MTESNHTSTAYHSTNEAVGQPSWNPISAMRWPLGSIVRAGCKPHVNWNNQNKGWHCRARWPTQLISWETVCLELKDCNTTITRYLHMNKWKNKATDSLPILFGIQWCGHVIRDCWLLLIGRRLLLFFQLTVDEFSPFALVMLPVQ